MAHSLSAQKRVRQNTEARARNRWRLKTMREALKEFNELLLHGEATKAQESFKSLSRLIDRTAATGVIHKNQAARRKSRLSAKLKLKISGGGVKAPAAKAPKVAAAKPAAAAAKAGAPKAAAPKTAPKTK